MPPYHIWVTFCCALCFLASGSLASPSFRNSAGGQITQKRLGDNSWISSLRNPCKHTLTSTHSEAASDPAFANHHEILTVRGREAEIRSLAGNTLSRLRQMAPHLVSLEINWLLVLLKDFNAKIFFSPPENAQMTLSAYLPCQWTGASHQQPEVLTSKLSKKSMPPASTWPLTSGTWLRIGRAAGIVSDAASAKN